jgi:flagellar protein FliL
MPDANSAEAAEAQAAPKKSKKLLIIILLACVVMAGAGGGGFYFFSHAGAQAQGADAKDKDKKSKKEVVPKAPAVYVKFDPPFVVNFEAKGMTRFLQVSVEVMTRDPATADLIKGNDPMLRNDLLLLLGNQTYETISTRDGKERLRGEALQVVAKVVASEGGTGKNVEQLYFTSFVMQ